jgi:hypothetical protein
LFGLLLWLLMKLLRLHQRRRLLLLVLLLLVLHEHHSLLLLLLLPHGCIVLHLHLYLRCMRLHLLQFPLLCRQMGLLLLQRLQDGGIVVQRRGRRGRRTRQRDHAVVQ